MKYRFPSQRLSKGFTLLEVMIALAVLALALSAIITTASNNASNAARLRDKTFAHWVAMNKAAELQLATPWPSTGKKTGSEELANWEWFWRVNVEKTEDEYVRKANIEIRKRTDDTNSIHSLTTYLHQK